MKQLLLIAHSLSKEARMNNQTPNTPIMISNGSPEPELQLF